MDGEFVAECMLMGGPVQCGYSVLLNVKEWVVMKIKPGANVPVIMDVPAAIFGSLVKHGQFENVSLVTSYLLDGERMEPVKTSTPWFLKRPQREISPCVRILYPRLLRDCAATSASSMLSARPDRPSGRLMKL